MAVPHGVGEVWATMLWDLYWAMVDEYGWTANLNTGNAGNTKAIQLVTDGLKQQVCSPGFADARDAILDADVADNGGANQCLIWETFARRGLGFSAVQGSSNSVDDNTEAFDLPPSCQGIELTATSSPNPLPGGAPITYTLKAKNVSGGALSGVVLKSTLGSTLTYVAGSATCGGVYTSAQQDGDLHLQRGDRARRRTCTLQATAQASPVSSVAFEDDFEPNLSAWTATHGAGTVDWALSTAQAHSPTHSAFASDPAAVSDQYLRTTAPVAVTSGEQPVVLAQLRDGVQLRRRRRRGLHQRWLDLERRRLGGVHAERLRRGHQRRVQQPHRRTVRRSRAPARGSSRWSTSTRTPGRTSWSGSARRPTRASPPAVGTSTTWRSARSSRRPTTWS